VVEAMIAPLSAARSITAKASRLAASVSGTASKITRTPLSAAATSSNP